MKKTLLLIIGILISLNISAQTAEDYLNSVIEKNKSYNDISLVFNFTLKNNDAGINEKMTGHASIKGDSYLMNIDGQVTISNGKTLWTHLIDDEEVMISEVTEDNNNSPIAFVENFSKNVNATFLKNDTDTKTIELKEKETSSFEKITITIDNKALKIRQIHAIDLEGSEFIYDITEFTTNQNLPDSMFIFDENQYPNVEIIDMR